MLPNTQERNRTFLATIAAALAVASTAPLAAHSLAVPHASGTAPAEYRGAIGVQHKQVGTPSPGGRPSTLRCVWTANMEVNRVASTAAGALASRSFVQADVANGSRPGWCSANRSVIARDVAQRLGDGSEHLAQAAAEDRAVLLTELDRLAPAAVD